MSEKDFDSLGENMNSVWEWLDPKQTYYQFSPASSYVDCNQQDVLSVCWPWEDQFGPAGPSFNSEGSCIPSKQVNNTLPNPNDQGGSGWSGWEDNFDSVMQWFDPDEKTTCSLKKSVPKSPKQSASKSPNQSASKSPKQSSSEQMESGHFRYVFLIEQYDKWCNVDGWNDEWGKFGGGYDDEKVDPISVPSKNPIQPSVPINEHYNSSEGAGAELYNLSEGAGAELYNSSEGAGAKLYSNSLTDAGYSDPYDWPKGQDCGDYGLDQGTSQNWAEHSCYSWPVGSLEWAQYPEYSELYARQSPGNNSSSINCSSNLTKGNSERNQKYNYNENAVYEKNKNRVGMVYENGEATESVPPKNKKKKPKKKKKPQFSPKLQQNDFDPAYGLPHQDWCEQAENHYAWDRWSRLKLLHYHADLYWQNLPNQYEQLYYEDALLRKKEDEFWFSQEMHARSADWQSYNRPNCHEKLFKKHESCTYSGAVKDDVNYIVPSSYVESSSTYN